MPVKLPYLDYCEVTLRIHDNVPFFIIKDLQKKVDNNGDHTNLEETLKEKIDLLQELDQGYSILDSLVKSFESDAIVFTKTLGQPNSFVKQTKVCF